MIKKKQQKTEAPFDTSCSGKHHIFMNVMQFVNMCFEAYGNQNGFSNAHPEIK